MEELEQSVNTAEVAEPSTVVTETPEVVETQEPGVNDSEVADQKPVQDAETNARYAEMRRNQEINEFKTKASTYEENLNRIARYAGYESHDEMIKAVEEAERQQQIQQEAQRLGINEDAYKQHFEPVNSKMGELEKELETLRTKEKMREVETELKTLSEKYPDFSEYEEKVFTVAAEKGYSLEDAYKIATYDDRLAKVAREKEQEVLAKVTGRDEKQVLASNDQPNNTKFDPNSMSLEEIEALSRRARLGERITF
ncbi:hypothetical protein MKY20_11510 [Cytobacillus sp. FSL W8-0315]|uniref:hypothetical protein n=1 Tax=Cytobacillus sp. FSL W8-0315 TaxID=2921600 RepID=UPI0030F4D691